VTEPLLNFDSPCTCETLRLACGDELVKKAQVLPKMRTGSAGDQKEEKLWAIRP
jgi:hypothetical protein